MKPLYLEFKGVNSFSEKTTIDFRALLGGGVFGIFGDTGSGKSTILDCIHLALYGKIGRSSEQDCINYHCDGYEIVYEFELLVDGARKTYRVERKRKKKNNLSDAALYEKTDDGKWLAIAGATREVNQKLLSIIGLEYEDFKVCIALPQGDFAKLVEARSSERLELVSRLFNLERYGKKLTQKIGEKKSEAEREELRLKTRLETLGACGEEELAARKSRVQALNEELSSLTQRWERLAEQERALQKLFDKKSEKDKVVAALADFESERENYESLRTKIERYPALQEAKRQLDERLRLEKKYAELSAKTQTVQDLLTRASARLGEVEKAFEEKKFDETITQIEVKIAQSKSLDSERKQAEETRKELESCRAEFKLVKAETVEEKFDEKLREIDEKLLRLGGDQTLTEYLKNNFKDVLLCEEYGEVRKDLRALGEEYSIDSARLDPLLEKYTPVRQGDEKSFDVAAAKLAFDKADKERKAATEERLGIERRKMIYETNSSRLAHIRKRGDELRASLDGIERKIAEFGLESPQELERKKSAVIEEKTRFENAVKTAREQSSNRQAEAREHAAFLSQTAEDCVRAKERFEQALQDCGYCREQELLTAASEVRAYETDKARVEKYFAAVEALKMRLVELGDVAFSPLDELRLKEVKSERTLLDERKQTLAIECGAAQRELDDLTKKSELAAGVAVELTKVGVERERYEKLWGLTKGGAFMNFIAGEYLQDVSRQASVTLLSLTGGRYFLLYENKEFVVGDNLNGGEKRAVRTLSGGETFLVSLSLALSLSSAICESVRHIEFFFLDEGFGTLDQKLVETVMDVLGKLSKDFSIGLISHVEELKHRIHHKVIVESANERHGSTVRLETH